MLIYVLRDELVTFDYEDTGRLSERLSHDGKARQGKVRGVWREGRRERRRRRRRRKKKRRSSSGS